MDQANINWLLAAALLPWGVTTALLLWSSRQSVKKPGTHKATARLIESTRW